MTLPEEETDHKCSGNKGCETYLLVNELETDS